MSLSVQKNSLLFGPLCKSPYPALPHHLNSFYLAAHMAHIGIAGPLQPDELEQVANPLSPLKRGMWFGMLYHTLIGLLLLLGDLLGQGGVPGHAAMLK